MDKSPDAFRSIGEVSRLVGVAPHVLRYWESQFTLLAPVKRADGRRYYRPDDVRLVAGLCQVMREEGLSIRGAKRLIATDRGAGLREIGALRLGEGAAETPEPAPAPEAPEPRAAKPARRAPRPAESLPLFDGIDAGAIPETAPAGWLGRLAATAAALHLHEWRGRPLSRAQELRDALRDAR